MNTSSQSHVKSGKSALYSDSPKSEWLDDILEAECILLDQEIEKILISMDFELSPEI